MSLDNPFDQNNQNTDPYAWNPGNYNPNPTYDNTNINGVPQTSLNGFYDNSYAANPNSAYAGFGPPQGGGQPNVFGTNLFDSTQPYSTSATGPSTSFATINAGINAAVNPQTPAAPGSTGTTGGTTGGTSGGTTSGGTTGTSGYTYGTGAPGGSSGGAATGGNPSLIQAVWGDPQNFYLQYQKQLADMGVNPASGTPLAQYAQRQATRAYADYLARTLENTAPSDDTTQAISDFLARGGRNGPSSAAATLGSTLAGLVNQASNGTLATSDPRYSTVEYLMNTPTVATQLMANLAPNGPFSRYYQQYLQDAANYNQVAGQEQPKNYLQALLNTMGY